jgi:hypothetical protein
MHALLGLEVQSKVGGEVIFFRRDKTRLSAASGRLDAARKVDDNLLFGGSSPSSPTTQSDPNGRLPVSDQEPAIGGYSAVQMLGVRSLPAAEVAVRSISPPGL